VADSFTHSLSPFRSLQICLGSAFLSPKPVSMRSSARLKGFSGSFDWENLSLLTASRAFSQSDDFRDDSRDDLRLFTRMAQNCENDEAFSYSYESSLYMIREERGKPFYPASYFEDAEFATHTLLSASPLSF
jgi:hypothetical protein